MVFSIPETVSTLIFDLGEVIVHIDPSETTRQMSNVLGLKAEEIYSFQKQNTLIDQYERGDLNTEDFLEHLQEISKKEVSKQEIANAWNAMLQDIPVNKLNILTELKKQFRVLALSNTNELHIQWINQFMESNFKKPGLEPFFHHVYYSNIIGHRKPEHKCYQYVLNNEDVLASRCLLIDDRLDNLEAAKSLGIHTLHLSNPDQLYDFFA